MRLREECSCFLSRSLVAPPCDGIVRPMQDGVKTLLGCSGNDSTIVIAALWVTTVDGTVVPNVVELLLKDIYRELA
ncbi:hypothetical protein J6590_058692 [Homalodisca vitripennis]|nr:hypothetical protein J6590_058692 [Homalodisca vitripennis]